VRIQEVHEGRRRGIMRAILVSVGYSDLLALTLPFNRKHFSSVLVVTSTADEGVVGPICKAAAADMLVTDAFYEGRVEGGEPIFRKWKALEEGLDLLRGGPHGWLCVMDADILWPRNLPSNLESTLRPGCLTTPLRRMMTDITGLTTATIPDESRWGEYPIHRNVAEWAGYSQIFHTLDPVLPRPPWYDTRWRHAGGADSFFQSRWPAPRKIRPNWEVLHLGCAGTNWFGRASRYTDGTLPDQATTRTDHLVATVRARKPGPDRHNHELLPPEPSQ
jgi:hypothetical protein